jgi:hypothetical protein
MRFGILPSFDRRAVLDLAELRAAAREAGREPAAIEVTVRPGFASIEKLA